MADDQNAGTDASAAATADTDAAAAAAAVDKGTAGTAADKGGKASSAHLAADPGADKDGGAAATGADKAPDWRQRLAGDNKEDLKTLERITDERALWASYKALRDRVSKGDIGPKRPGKDAKSEEWAEWRKAVGLPEKPSDYKVELPDGRVLGDDDKPVADSFIAAMHEEGVPPSTVNKAVAWYLDQQEKQAEALIEADETFKSESQTTLREEWGADFRRNINVIPGLFATAEDGLFDRILGGRTADGRRLGDDPAVLRWLSGLALEINPAAAVMPRSADAAKSMDGRISEIEGMMRAEPDKYWKSESIQKEYRDLIEARDKVKARNAA